MATPPNKAPPQPNARFPPQYVLFSLILFERNPLKVPNRVFHNNFVEQHLHVRLHSVKSYLPKFVRADVDWNIPLPHLCFRKSVPTDIFDPVHAIALATL